MPAIVVMLSVDTEEDNWRAARTDVSVENIRELPRFQRYCERLGVRPTYFTTYQVASTPWAGTILRGLAEGGRAELGAHLHPWNTPPLDEPLVPRNSMTKNLPRALQRAKVAVLTRELTELIGTAPSCFRAGRYGLGRETTQVLIELGYRVDSSVTPWVSWEAVDEGPDFIGAPVTIYALDGTTDPREAVPAGPLLEVPLSCGFLRQPFERWSVVYDALTGTWGRPLRLAGVAARLGLIRRVVLSPEISSAGDMLRLARHLVSHGVSHLHLSLHSPTLRPGLSPYAQSRRDVDRLYGRLDRFIHGLANIADIRFGTVGEAAGPAARPMAVRVNTKPLDPVAAELARPRRLLVISYHFPPDGAVGGLRWAGIGKYLVRQGWEVHVLTAASVPGPGLRDGIQIHVCPRGRTLLDLYGYAARELRGVLKRRRPGGAPVPSDGPARAGASGLRRAVASLLWFPDESRGWTLRAVVRARALLRRIEPDVVVTSGPPHTAHIVGAWATIGSGVPLVADLRDPWVFHRHVTKLERALARFLQHRVLTVARDVIANTQELAAQLRAKDAGLRVTWVRNGVDVEALPLRGDGGEPGFTVVHAGNLYWRRSLDPVLRAFRVFLDRHPDAASTARIRLAGLVEPRQEVELRDQVQLAALEPFVERLGVVPRAEALRMAARSSVSIVLAQDQERQVPAKLYELVAMRVPTVVITERGSAAAVEGDRLGANVVAPEEVGRLADLFGDCWQGRAAAAPAPRESVDYATLARRISEVLVPSDAA
jgi:glycosyltransferase involved in cell wall biosynthesis